MAAKKKVMIGVNPHDTTEKISSDMFSLVLHREGLSRVEKFGEKKEHVDGLVSFLTQDNQPLMIEGTNGARDKTFPHVFYQIKSTTVAGISHYDCDHRFLYRVFHDDVPTLMVFVNITDELIYYEYLSRAYIVENLSIPDIAQETRNEIRLNFTDTKILSGAQQLIDGYQEERSRLESLETYGASSSPQEIKDHKDSIRGVMAKNVGTAYDLEALIYYNFPLKMSEVEKITALCDKLSVSRKEFDYMVEVLGGVNAVQITDDLISVVDVKVAKTLLDDLITKRGMEFIL